MSQRAQAILDDEFVRITPGLRVFSVGILTLCRKLGLSVATGETAAEPFRETLTLAWMLDERHPIEEIRALCYGPADPREAALDAYEWTLTPDFLVRVRGEIARTNAAVEAASFEIENKPESRAGPHPAGK